MECGPKIILVEDHADIRKIFTMLLRDRGYQVTSFRCGKDALLAARQSLPDAMIIDLGLPDISGFKLAQKVRRSAGLANALLVALTGHQIDLELSRLEAVGFDHHFIKPFDSSDVCDWLEQQLAAVHTRHQMRQAA